MENKFDMTWNEVRSIVKVGNGKPITPEQIAANKARQIERVREYIRWKRKQKFQEPFRRIHGAWKVLRGKSFADDY